jgi:hypothetical protein
MRRFVLTRSAQDLGGAFTGGFVVIDVCSGARRADFSSSLQDGRGASSTDIGDLAASASFVDTDAALTETLTRPGQGWDLWCAGIIGTRGTAGLALGLPGVDTGCILVDATGGTAEEGVVGLVESASEELAKSLAFQFLIVLVQAVWDLVDDVFHPQHRSLAVLPEMETQRVHWMMVVLFASVACVEILRQRFFGN